MHFSVSKTSEARLSALVSCSVVSSSLLICLLTENDQTIEGRDYCAEHARNINYNIAVLAFFNLLYYIMLHYNVLLFQTTVLINAYHTR